MLFILSTGRSGTVTLAQLLNQIPGIEAFHEKPPELVPEARAYLKGDLPRDQLVALLRNTRKPSASRFEYAESNQKFSFIIDALREAFPKARYVWLIRNGLEVVSSWAHRKNYWPHENKGIWSAHRIRGDEVGAMSPSQWAGLSPFGKCCWYWAWTNNKIEADLKATDAKWMLLRLEDLDSRIHELASFVGLQGTDALEIPTANKSTGRVARWHYWDRAQRADFSHFCSDLMDRFYKGWRERFVYTTGQVARNEVLRVLSDRSASGRLLRSVTTLLPKPVRTKTAHLLNGRGILRYPIKD